MKVGDYVRTKDGKIAKIINIEKSLTFAGYEERITTDKFKYSSRDMVIIKKSSPNIIDLIEVGDYVNGMLVTNIWVDKETNNIEFEFNNHESYLYPKSWNYESRVTKYKIKSIVTKEQFESMEYKVEEKE